MALRKINSIPNQNLQRGDRETVDQSKRRFLKLAVLAGGAALAKFLPGCADIESCEIPQEERCSTNPAATSCSYRDADSKRCSVWEGSYISLESDGENGPRFLIENIRWDGTEYIVDAKVLIPPSCESLFGEDPVPIHVPGIGIFPVAASSYRLYIYYAFLADGGGMSWVDAELERIPNYCDRHTIRETLTAGDGSSLSSYDGNVKIELAAVETSPKRAVLKVYDSENQLKGLLPIAEGEIRCIQVGEKFYPIRAHVVVSSESGLESCADLSIDTCDSLPSEGGIILHW